jgi:hypothetical protein
LYRIFEEGDLVKSIDKFASRIWCYFARFQTTALKNGVLHKRKGGLDYLQVFEIDGDKLRFTPLERKRYIRKGLQALAHSP